MLQFWQASWFVRQGDRVDVQVSGLSSEGTGLSELAGQRFEITGVFAGERARVRIEHVAKRTQTVFARLDQLHEKHPARRTIPCPAHEFAGGHCSGCAFMALEEGAQREAKRAALSELGLSVDEVIASGPAFGYRWSSKRTAFRARVGLRLGSYARGTHAPAFMRDCRVDHPRIVAAFAELETAAQQLGIIAFDEARGTGDLRHVWAKTNGIDVILTLITVSEQSKAAERLPEQLTVAGVCHNVQSAQGNAVRGTHVRPLRGVQELHTTIAGHDIEIGALGFLQPNPAVIELAYRDLTSHEPIDGSDLTADRSSGLAFDLYAGAGITTRLLRERFAEVIPCESYAESALALGVAPTSVEAFLAERLAQSQRNAPELVIANPPRKGLGDAVCKQLLELAPRYLGIMSCGPAGLARDLALLGARYRLTSLNAYDTLPQTPHVELVAKLVRT